MCVWLALAGRHPNASLEVEQPQALCYPCPKSKVVPMHVCTETLLSGRVLLTIIARYLARQILLTSLVTTVIGAGPIILVSLFMQLPGDAIFSRLTLPALATIAPMVAYHALPLTVAV